MKVTCESLLNLVPRFRDVQLPYGRVQVRELSTAEVLAFSAMQKVSQEEATAYLLRTAARDEDANSLFGSASTDQLIRLPYAIVNAIVDPILDLSGLKETAEKKPSDSTPAAPK